MKFALLLLAGLALLAQENAAEAGRMGPHFGNNPPHSSHCIHFRFSAICEPHSHGPAVKSEPQPATCEILSSTAPKDRELKIEFTYDDKMLVEGSNAGIGYNHDEEGSSAGREAYVSMRPDETSLPGKIYVVSSEDKPYNHKIMRVSFDHFEETLDCSFSF